MHKQKTDPDELYLDLTEEEWNELHLITTHTLRYKGLADGCETWDEVLQQLNLALQGIQELKGKNAEIIDNQESFLFYQIPGEYGAYATYEGLQKRHYQFKLLHNGHIVTAPLEDPDCLTQTPIGTRIAILLNPKEEVQAFRRAENQQS
ncbi:MAG: hypothetical protein ACFFDP_11305 [Promethearchaeota archaeon]